MKKLLFVALFGLSVSAKAGLTVINSTNTPGTNSAVLYGTLTDYISEAELSVYYGQADGGSNATSWSRSISYGSVTETGTVYATATNLSPATYYYYRWRAVDSGTTNWASGSSNFLTTATAPTYPTEEDAVTVMAQKDGTLLSPTNFFQAAGIVTGESSVIRFNLTNYPGIVTISGSLVSYDSGASQLIFEPVFGTGSTDSARGDWFAVASNEVDLIDGRVTTLESNIKVLDRYQARDTAGTEVNVGASLAGVTVSLTGTVFYVSNPTNCIITSLEIYWPNTSGDSFDVVLDYNGMPHDSPTSRFTASIYALREQDGAPVAGASARPDPSNYDRIKVMGLSGATSYIVRLLLL